MLFFFLLMIRRPPRSTLFPTRRSSDLSWSKIIFNWVVLVRFVHMLLAAYLTSAFCVAATGAWYLLRSIHLTEARVMRSEEHTSELQSRPHLVCRLLLEKKNEPSGGVDR